MIPTILALCSRDIGHENMYLRLRGLLESFLAAELPWRSLIEEAEVQGLAPLLYRHVTNVAAEIPLIERRLLKSLYLRSRHSNNIRSRAVAEVLRVYALENIDVLTVKGIALSHFVYSETSLRPMRDVDLLVRENDLDKAERMLGEIGYLPETVHDIPDDYYHRVPLTKTCEGLPVSIELHRNLLPFHPQYPLWPLEKSYPTAIEIEINGVAARTLCLEDTLRYVFLHGFRAPLTYEPFRLIHAADIVNLVEKFLSDLDWARVTRETPGLLNVLSSFHHLTPWREEIVNLLELDITQKPTGVGIPYKGWPQRKLKTVKLSEWPGLVKDTLWPHQWWMQVYYSHLNRMDYMTNRLIIHPRSVWRWAKAYFFLYVRRWKANVS